MFYQDHWGTICGDGWDMREGNVICRQLGYPSASKTLIGAHFGQGCGPVHRVNCYGNESSIDQCLNAEPVPRHCSHSDDAGVICGILNDAPVTGTCICKEYDG